jgi:hypothetical protein
MHNSHRESAPRHIQRSPENQPHNERIHRIPAGKRKKRARGEISLPLRIIQSNDRISEVQFICDYCEKIIKTSLISKDEVDAQKNKSIVCWHCKQNIKGKKL